MMRSVRADFKKQTENFLVKFLLAQQQTAPTKEAKLLIERINTLVMRAGKRFRPTLMVLTYQSYGGKQSNRLIPLAGALELFHQALLIHDDLIDNDLTRHGGPNIAGFYKQDKKYKSTSIPVSMELLAGDLLFSLVNTLVIQDKFLNSQQKLAVLTLFSSTTKIATYGQQLDLLAGTEYIKQTKLAELKTAEYSTKLPMRLAAVILDLSLSE